MKLYAELAKWWPLLSPVEDYAEEASFYCSLIASAGLSRCSSLLELGCGGGSNAFYLKKLFDQVTLSDLSEQMLRVSQALNPECEHVQGDMRALRLDRTFDVVFVHDAIDYMTTLGELQQALATVRAHCHEESLAIVVCDHVREDFKPATEHGGSDAEERSLRFLEWSYDSDPNDSVCEVEYVVAYRDGSGPAIVEHERHVCGLFTLEQWLACWREEGFMPAQLRMAEGQSCFVARIGAPVGSSGQLN